MFQLEVPILLLSVLFLFVSSGHYHRPLPLLEYDIAIALRMFRIRNPAITTSILSTNLRPTHLPNPLRTYRPLQRRRLISPPPGRPQLPFLTPATENGPKALPQSRQQFTRLMTTERRNYYKQRATRIFLIVISIQTVLALIELAKFCVRQDKIEHNWPTPPEWGFKLRWYLRSAEALQHPMEVGYLMTNWHSVAGYLGYVVDSLEDGHGYGEGIVQQDGDAFDISIKSEPWRRGYFQALMGLARAAENLEGWVTDTKQGITRPIEYMIGPSNPRPKPIPPTMRNKKVPREEDSEPASTSPENYYRKVLMTTGFDTRQKIDAALAWADWLDYKGLDQNANEVYKWATDIAASGLPTTDPNKIVDMKTGILKNNQQYSPSENLLRVSTARAVHYAQHGDVSSALPIFLSVLKARRNLPQPPSSEVSPTKPKTKRRHTNNAITSFIETLKIAFIPVEYPPPTPTGNTPPKRTNTSICDEAALMTYIGEIIYATSSHENGLAWTRDAVDQAEETFIQINEIDDDDTVGKQKCSECMKVGFKNWSNMLSRLISRAEKVELNYEEAAANKGLFESWYYKRQVRVKNNEKNRWLAEKLIVDDRAKELWPAIMGLSVLDLFAPLGTSLF